ncbi:MAG: TIGR04190 family B12-binding domain/radical SAM domain protein [Actinobacteria bacterium]|nr:TIGR04190 family B12-binding domain/radical SAM domain protein [Actinomycetota bacterium]
MKFDVVFIHSPSIYDFREKPILFGPVSDVIPSTPVFEMYPIGFVVLSDYLERRGYRTRIVNLAVRMLKDPDFDVESFIRSIDTRLFALDLHWLPHAQGAIEVAKIIKKNHHNVPIVFGGLSSTYFHEELIRYPQVDMVLKGDSTEEPIRILIDVIRKGGSFSEVPNLTWKDMEGGVNCQPITYVPEKWNHSRINYARIIKSVIRDRDLKSYLPFKDFLRYPIVASFMCRGGLKNCTTCGGSKFSFAKFFNRPKAALREPEDLALDIASAASCFNGPVFLVGDIQSGGPGYIDKFLDSIARYRLNNMIIFEFWELPEKETFERISKSLKNWSFEISCESQDESVRKKFGRADFSNDSFKQSIIDGLKAGAHRADVYFLTGIPFQTKESIMGIPGFVEHLYDGFNGERKKLVCCAAPLAPFVDPGSLAFEKPDRYGYKIVSRTLEQHRAAMVLPSWKYWLNYESNYIDRDTLVETTYDCALELNEVKRRVGAVSDEGAERVKKNILNAKDAMRKIDAIYNSNLSAQEKEIKYFALKDEMVKYSMSTVCGKKELEWNVSTLRKFKARGFIKAMLSP